MGFLTVPEVAERLGITRQRVLALINHGRLPAQRLGYRRWIVDERDLALVTERKPGAPKGNRNARGKGKGKKKGEE